MNWLMRERSNYLEVLKLQNCILNITQYIDSFCAQYNIDYFLMGGSAIGAIRHEGFIPWDDDLDIFMTPTEYELFREKFQSNGDTVKYYLQEWGACDGMVSLAKLRLNKSTFIERDLQNWDINQGVYVDIFILHSCPDNKILRLNQYIWAKYIVAKGAANRGMRKQGLLGLLLLILDFFPKRFLLKFALKQVYYHNSETEFLCHFLGRAGFKSGLYKRAYFETYRRTNFELIYLNVPKYVERYLFDRWGDYMKIPAIEDTLKYQHSWKWSDSKYFSGFKESGIYDDEKYLLT